MVKFAVQFIGLILCYNALALVVNLTRLLSRYREYPAEARARRVAAGYPRLTIWLCAYISPPRRIQYRGASSGGFAQAPIRFAVFTAITSLGWHPFVDALCALSRLEYFV